MFAAFGVLLPAGVLAAHSFRDWPPHWWRAHAAFMTAGYAAALLGFGAGMAMTVDSPALSIHRWIGVAVLSALTLQARARPCAARRPGCRPDRPASCPHGGSVGAGPARAPAACLWIFRSKTSPEKSSAKAQHALMCRN